MLFDLVVALAASITASAIPCPSPVACPTNFRIHPNGNTEYCLSVADVDAAGSPATVQKCDGSNGQTWWWDIPTNSEWVHLRNLASGKNPLGLAAESAQRAPMKLGDQLVLAERFDDGSHTWYPIAESGMIVTTGLINDQDVCMDLRDGNLDGGAVQVWTCDSCNTNQQWTISTS